MVIQILLVKAFKAFKGPKGGLGIFDIRPLKFTMEIQMMIILITYVLCIILFDENGRLLFCSRCCQIFYVH
jgi:hypothetical protein